MGFVEIQDWILYGVGLFAILVFLMSIMLFVAIRNNAPDAFVHWSAKRKGKPVCRVHFRGKQTKDYIAEVEKAEREMGTSYWSVPEIGIKFKPEADCIHFIEDSLPCCDYYENIPKSIKMEIAVAYSQLKTYFKKIGIPIDGIEDLMFYVASESEISNPDTAILDARINSKETQSVIRQAIAKINTNKEKLKALKLESGFFTWQTAMNALDSTIAYTSASLTHTIETVKAAERRKEENKRKDMMTTISWLMALAIIGIIVLYGLKGL